MRRKDHRSVGERVEGWFKGWLRCFEGRSAIVYLMACEGAKLFGHGMEPKLSGSLVEGDRARFRGTWT